MRVSIVGPGALGCLFAVRLAKGGATVTLVDHLEDRAKRLSDCGVTVLRGEDKETAAVPVSLAVPDRQDLIIVLVKSYRTSSLQLPVGVPVLSLQNGLGNVETLCSMVSSACVIAGTTTEAATLESEGVSRHVASGETLIGAWTTCNSAPAIDILTRAGFPSRTTDAPGQALWEKVVLSAGINPLTALIGTKNGRLIQIPEARQLMRDLVVESVKVATLEGYRFPYSLVERVEEVCRETANNVSSMLQDIRAQRRTEIDAISGELLRRGQLAGIQMPKTRAVWQLVKGLEAAHMDSE